VPATGLLSDPDATYLRGRDPTFSVRSRIVDGRAPSTLIELRCISRFGSNFSPQARRLESMSEPARHIAQNEVILREVNERIAEKTMDLGIRGLAGEDETSEYLCACGRPDCDASLNLTLAELEDAHSRPDQFVVARGHDLPDIEEVVAERDGYCVVRKKPGFKPQDVNV
jgi:hypothetical protein